MSKNATARRALNASFANRMASPIDHALVRKGAISIFHMRSHTMRGLDIRVGFALATNAASRSRAAIGCVWNGG